MAKDPEPLSFGARLWLSFIMPWRVLLDGVFAARVEGIGDAPALPATEEPKKEIKVTEAEPDETPALQVLAILQREGRFVDFLNEVAAGNVYVADEGRSLIFKYDEDGNYLDSVAMDVQPVAVASDGLGNVYTVSNVQSRVDRFLDTAREVITELRSRKAVSTELPTRRRARASA